MHMNLGNNGHIRFHINYIAQDNISTKHMSNRHGCMTRKKEKTTIGYGKAYRRIGN